MKVSDFQKLIKRKYRFERYSAWTISIVAFLAGLYLAFYWRIGQYRNSTDTSFMTYSGIFLISFGLAGLLVLKNKYKISIVQNINSKEANQEQIRTVSMTFTDSNIDPTNSYISFPYQKSWWRLSYIIYLFADRNIIAVNVQSIGSSKSGFIDFGASKRLEKQILDMLH